MNGTVAYVLVTVSCLVAVAGVVVAVIALRAARKKAAAAAKASTPSKSDPFRSADDDADALRGDPRRLQPGDIVEIRHTSYGVRGTLRFTEGDWGWAEHLLDTVDGEKVWLSVEEDPDLELVLWTAEPAATVTPGKATLNFDGRRYTKKESGKARYTATGTTGLNPTGTVAYHDYTAGPARLSFESYGDSGKWEVARGERLHRAEVQIYPQAGSMGEVG